MVRLTSRNLFTLHNAILALYSDPTNIWSFPAHVIENISKVISSGVTSYAHISEQNRKIRYVGQASCRTWEKLDGFVRHMHEHPILNYLHPGLLKPHCLREDIERAVQKRFPSLRQAQHYTAARISDALTARQFRSLGIYNEFFGKNEVEYQMLISFLPSRAGYSMVSFNRDKRDFSEEERLMLNFLAPHIAQAFTNGAAIEKARRTFDALESSRQSLHSYGLTYREEDVLYWVAQGKTNAETAKILKIAPGTVKIHLEKIYQKLGVENRTSATAMAMGKMDRKKK